MAKQRVSLEGKILERESVLHVINKPRSLEGEGRAASQSGEGNECCFWTAACFRSEVIAWNGRCVQPSPREDESF